MVDYADTERAQALFAELRQLARDDIQRRIEITQELVDMIREEDAGSVPA